MTVSYLSSFDLRRITWGITLTPASGGTAVTLNSASFAKPCHIHGPAGVAAWALASDDDYTIGDNPANDDKYSDLVFGTNCAFYANTTASGWTVATTITFVFDIATLRYTISRSSGDSFSVSFTGDGAALFGFAGNSASATTHTGTRTPLYAIRASSPGLSNDTGDRKRAGQSSLAIADSGGSWAALARSAPIVTRDWEQRFESKALTWSEYSTTAAPWTFEDLFDLARLGLPFCVRDSEETRQGLYLLRKGEDGFEPEPHSENNHVQLRIRFSCVKIGTRSV